MLAGFTSAPAPNFASPQLGSGIDTAKQANRYNLDYLNEAIPGYGGNTNQLSSTISNLLNPYDPTAMRDVAQSSAEMATAGGYAGAPLADYGGYRMRQADIERRAALGSNLLSGQVQRTPQPFNLQQWLTTPYQAETLAQNWYRLLHPDTGGGRSGGGGGGGFPSSAASGGKRTGFDLGAFPYGGAPGAGGYTPNESDPLAGWSYDDLIGLFEPESTFQGDANVNPDLGYYA